MFNNLIFVNNNFLKNINKIYFKKEIKFSYKLVLEKNINDLINYNLFSYIKKNKNIKEDYILLKANFENYKKRSEDEISKIYKYAIEDFSENIIFILDSLESALLDKSNNLEKNLEGIRLTLKLFHNIMEKNNIKQILPSENEVFDPHKHLAVSIINNCNKNNTIVNVLQKGYTIFERILRPALVVVNKV